MLINQNSPIGIFDSGVGGLSVLRAIRALLPEWLSTQKEPDMRAQQVVDHAAK